MNNIFGYVLIVLGLVMIFKSKAVGKWLNDHSIIKPFFRSSFLDGLGGIMIGVLFVIIGLSLAIVK